MQGGEGAGGGGMSKKCLLKLFEDSFCCFVKGKGTPQRGGVGWDSDGREMRESSGAGAQDSN